MEIIKADTPNTFIMIVSAEQLVTMAVAWGMTSTNERRKHARRWKTAELPAATVDDDRDVVAGFSDLYDFIHKHFPKKEQGEEDGTRQDGRE